MTHRNPVLHAMAAAVAACALVAPTASAAPVEEFLPRAEAEPGTGSSRVPPPPSSIATAAAEEYAKLRAPDVTIRPVRVVTVQADGGFDWGDAGIGATGALALTAIGGGAALALGRGPGRRRVPRAIR